MSGVPKGKRRVIVIGGGVTGLAAAHRFIELSAQRQSPFEILLLEAGARLGGIVRTHKRDGFLLEGGPDSFISEKPAAIELARRIALDKHLIQTESAHRRSFIVRDKRLRLVPQGFQLLAPSRFWPFITSEIFSWTGKARIALDLILPRSKSQEEDESLAAFVRRRFGREALERMAQPMVGGIYTADPETLSLRATMPRFLEMERTERSLIRAMRRANRKSQAKETNGTSGARYSLFLSFDEGMQTLTDALAARLPPDSIRLNTKVRSLVCNRISSDGEAKRWRVITESGEAIEADALCVALPAHATANLVGDVDDELASILNLISYASTATVNLAYKREDVPHKLDGFGFVTPAIERLSTLACTFSSVKFFGRAPEGCVLLRAFVGGALQPEMFELDEKRMLEAVQADLRLLLGIETRPLFSLVEKWPDSMPQYTLGHTERIGKIRARVNAHPTLQLAGNYFDGAGIPDSIRSGERAAENLAQYL
ncbi:MAG: protoporphyrinogen oxidase [Pyrinomonadaceae bacterium]|nr:protoporphyrinogen oxidase [Pyrinomonadaceae bacterium]